MQLSLFHHQSIPRINLIKKEVGKAGKSKKAGKLESK